MAAHALVQSTGGGLFSHFAGLRVSKHGEAGVHACSTATAAAPGSLCIRAVATVWCFSCSLCVVIADVSVCV